MNEPLDAALRATHEIAEVLRERREALRRAVCAGDPADVIRCARELLGMEIHEASESHRTAEGQ